MQGNPVVWFEIYVQDMKRAKAFYQGVLGVELRKLESPAEDMMEMWAFPSKETPWVRPGRWQRCKAASNRAATERSSISRAKTARWRKKGGAERRQGHEKQILDRPVRRHRACDRP